MDILIPKINEIKQALQTEEPTDREIWILKQCGGSQ